MVASKMQPLQLMQQILKAFYMQVIGEQQQQKI